MRRPDPSEADRRTTRHSRRELEHLLARARRAIEAFATSDQGAAERPEPRPPARAKLLLPAAP